MAERDDVGADITAETHRAVEPGAAPSGFPSDVPDFTGRGGALRNLDSLLLQPDEDRPYAVVIEGMPGVGKTALTIHWANTVRDRYRDGLLYVNLRGQSDQTVLTQDEALWQILIALGTPARQIPDAGEPRVSAYHKSISQRRVLIVLDNVAGEDQARALIPRIAGALAILTSRSHLRDFAQSSRVLTLRLGVLSPDEAIALLTVTLGEQRVAREIGATRELASICGYLPLALRIAAANLSADPDISINDAVRNLEKGRLSALTLRDDPSIAVRNTLDLSYHSLDVHLQRVFRLLGLFAGHDITAEAAAALLGIYPEETEAVLSRLKLANLIETTAPGRYRFHDLLHEYAGELAAAEDDSAERRSAVHRLMTWYLLKAQEVGGFLGQQRRNINGHPRMPGTLTELQDRADRLTWLENERQNLVAATRQAAAVGDDRLTWELADALYDFLYLRGYSGDNIEVHTIGLAAARQSQQLLPQVYMRQHLSVIYRTLGRYHEAEAEAEQALTLSTKLDDRYLAAAVRNNLARIQYDTGRYGDSLRNTQAALLIRQNIGDRIGEAQTMTRIGRTLQALGRYSEALQNTRRALAIRQEAQDRPGEGETLDILARLYRMSGSYLDALECGRKALDIRRDLGDRVGQGESLQSLARVYRRLGNYSQAQEYAGQALEIMRTVSHARGVAEAHATLGDIYLDSSRDSDALDSYLSAMRIRTEIGDQRGMGESHLNLARAYRRDNEYGRSVDHAQQALGISLEIGDRFGQARALDSLARVYQLMNQYEEALDCTQEALTIIQEIGDRRGEGDTLDNISRIYHRTGKHEAALAFAGRAYEILNEIGDRRGRGKALDSMARENLDLGRTETAIQAARKAAYTWAELGDRRSMAETLDVLVTIAARDPRASSNDVHGKGPIGDPGQLRSGERGTVSGGPDRPHTMHGTAQQRWRILHSFIEGFGGILDLFGSTRPTAEQLPSFESTLAPDVHELCVALGLVPDHDGPSSQITGS